jgi:predicted DNA-binding transcriptional regulator YafY
MAKQDYILRYLTIIRKLRKSGEATFSEIRQYLEQESEIQDRPFTLSSRTFQRDLQEIRTLFLIDIQFNFSSKVYYIADDQQTDLNNRMLESIDTLNSLKLAGDMSRYMIFEKRKARGTHHFYGLLHAIRNRIVINLVHQKYDDDEPTGRLAEPLALKESKGRWYLFAKDRNDKKFKTFGLDRILDFENTASRFDYPAGLDVNEVFRHCFGVINPGNEAPCEIILSFSNEQGKYIKSYPIHESQTILADTGGGLKIKLLMNITHDLVMELLSYGDSVEVIAPVSLRKTLVKIHRGAVAKNTK